MKSLIRKLSIEDRKNYTYIIFYTFFDLFSAVLTKITTSTYEMTPYSYLTVRGAFIALICFFVLLKDMKKQNKREEIIEPDFFQLSLKGALVATYIVFQVCAYCYFDLRRTFSLIRYSPFLSLIMMNMTQSTTIRIYQKFGIVFGFLAIAIIMLPDVFYFSSSNESFGLFLSILVLFLESFFQTNYILFQNINNDLLLFFSYLFSIIITGFVSLFIATQNKLNFIGILTILLDSYMNYYQTYFQLSIFKDSRNILKFVPFCCLTILISYCIDIVLFDKTVYFKDFLGLLILIISAYYFTREVMKNHINKTKISENNKF